MELDNSFPPPTSQALHQQTGSLLPNRLAPLPQATNVNPLPPVPRNLYGSSRNRIAPIQVSQPPAYVAPTNAGLGVSATSSGAATNVSAVCVVALVVAGVAIIAGGIAIGVVVSISSNSGSFTTCDKDFTQIDITKLCDGIEDCVGGTDEDRCVIAPNGYQDGNIQVYSSSTRTYHKFCGFADGWTTSKSDAVCAYLGYSSSASTTEVSSSNPGIKSNGTDFVLQDIVTRHSEICTDNKVVEITCLSKSSCGVTSRIVGGSDADILDHPWQIALLRETASGTYHTCGGTIVSAEWVVSAAHCVDSYTSSDYPNVKVLVGRSTLAIDPTKMHSVDKIVYHPLYSSATLVWDIAVIHVSTSFSYDTNVRPACLPAPGETFGDLTQVVASGFGATSEGGSSSTTLQAVTMNLYNKATCMRTFSNLASSLRDGMICAGVVEGGKSTCQGDSGGPLIADRNSVSYLVGATNWGVGCARPGYPTVYAEVSYAVDWIVREMAKEV